jgi:hypothetical protein
VAQAQAVVGLAGQLGSSSAGIDGYIVTVLAGVMRNPAVFCRCGTSTLVCEARPCCATIDVTQATHRHA